MNIAQDRATRINGDIKAQEVRLVGIENEPIGVMSLSEALQQAEEADIDLVEIAPNAKPPVCRLMDYGKFKYAQSKKQHELKLKQKQVSVKEIKFRPGTDIGDYNIKMRNILKFIEAGDKVKITLRYRGREITHQEIGMALLRRVQEDTKEFVVVEQFPKMEGRQMVMVLAPAKKVTTKPNKEK